MQCSHIRHILVFVSARALPLMRRYCRVPRTCDRPQISSQGCMRCGIWGSCAGSLEDLQRRMKVCRQVWKKPERAMSDGTRRWSEDLWASLRTKRVSTTRRVAISRRRWRARGRWAIRCSLLTYSSLFSQTIWHWARLPKPDEFLRESLALAQEIGYRYGDWACARWLGLLAQVTSPDEARTLFAASCDGV